MGCQDKQIMKATKVKVLKNRMNSIFEASKIRKLREITKTIVWYEYYIPLVGLEKKHVNAARDPTVSMEELQANILADRKLLEEELEAEKMKSAEIVECLRSTYGLSQEEICDIEKKAGEAMTKKLQVADKEKMNDSKVLASQLKDETL